MNPTDPLPALPNYASWLTPETLATHVGVSSVVVNSWIVKGIRTDTGRIRLQAVKVGSRWKIDPAAAVKFFAATTAASLPPSARTPVESPILKPPSAADLRARAKAARAQLIASGLLTDGPPGKRKRTDAD